VLDWCDARDGRDVPGATEIGAVRRSIRSMASENQPSLAIPDAIESCQPPLRSAANL